MQNCLRSSAFRAQWRAQLPSQLQSQRYAPSMVHRGLLKGNRYICCVSREQQGTGSNNHTTPSNASTATKAGQQSDKNKEENKEDDSDDEYEFLGKMIEELNPATFFIALNLGEGFFVMFVAGVLGAFLSIDPWTKYILDWQAIGLGIQSSLPLLLLISLISLAPTGIGRPNDAQVKLMSKVEDAVLEKTEIVIDLSPLFASSMPAANNQPRPTVAATQSPLTSGLQLCQWWLTKPWYKHFSKPETVALTVASGITIAGSELLMRGLLVTAFAGWARDQVAHADTSSLLFYGKLFKLNGEELYRWIGTLVVAGFSLYGVSKEAERVQQWSRLLLYRLSEDRNKGCTADGKEADGSHASSTSNTGSTADDTVLSASSESTSDVPDNSTKDNSTSTENKSKQEGVGSIPGLKLLGIDTTIYGKKISMQSTAESLKVLGVEEADISAQFLRPTKEDAVVRNLAMLLGGVQVAQVAWLYGTTGTLVAPLAARLCLEILGNGLIQANTRVDADDKRKSKRS